MAPGNVSPLSPVFKLMLMETGSETAKLLTDAADLWAKYPDIQAAIAADQNAHGLAKKRKRQALEAAAGGSPKFAGMEDAFSQGQGAGAVFLSTGRPRLPSEVVFLFMVLRGRYGSLTDNDAADRFTESLSVCLYFANRGMEKPGRTTLLENVNAVSNRTRELILDAQVLSIIGEGLDDGDEIMVDSTAVAAASAFPCDVRLLLAFTRRAHKTLCVLEKLGMPEFSSCLVERWLKEAKSLHFQHNMARTKVKKRGHYKRLSKCLHGTLLRLVDALRDMRMFWQANPLPPRCHRLVRQRLDKTACDLIDAVRVLNQADLRILERTQVPTAEKVMSVCDADAYLIVKGGREPEFGFKPGLARGGNGFVYGLRLQSGNPADAPELYPLISQVIARTGKVPSTVIADDGYASKDGKAKVKACGVTNVVISGSKGKKMTPTDEWDAPEAQKHRNDRSAVESLMFTLKYVVGFGRMRRRGLEAVRAEMLEKIIAYNFRRIIQVREAKAQEAEQQQRQKAA